MVVMLQGRVADAGSHHRFREPVERGSWFAGVRRMGIYDADFLLEEERGTFVFVRNRPIGGLTTLEDTVIIFRSSSI